MKHVLGLVFFHIFRALERQLSVQALHGLLRPIFFVRAFFKLPEPGPERPGFLSPRQPVRAARQQRRRVYHSNFIEYIPDRLATPKWSGRCQIEGLAQLQRASAEKRPVILTTCHFGPFTSTRSWLRGLGIPAATFVGGQSSDRWRLARLKDRYTPLPEIPVAFYQDQLRELDRFLQSGNPLIIALDGKAGKKVVVPFCDGWDIALATGPMRLAARRGAELIPFTITDEGCWWTKIRIGQPVPREWLGAAPDFLAAGKHLIQEMLPAFHEHPEQVAFDLAIRFQKTGGAAVHKRG